MQWSKLKKNIEQRFAENLQGRLEIFETIYRMGYNHRIGEIWISLDKERIFSTSDFTSWARIRELESEGASYKEALDQTAVEGTHPVYNSNIQLFETLNMSIDELLASPVALVKGLAIADGRCGKRRLQKLKSGIENEAPFIQRIFNERLGRNGSPD